MAQTHPPKSVASLPPPSPAATSGGTRGFPRYPLDHPDLQQFIAFLKGLDGKRKSERESQAIAMDVSKFLKYAAPTAPNTRWELLLKMDKVQSYFDHLQDTAACGVDGQLTKMERLTVALTFYKLDILGEEDEAGYHQANRAIDCLAQWKATLHGGKRYRHQQRQVEEGDQSTSIEEATALLTCKKLWVDVSDFITLSKSGAADRVQLKVLTAALVGLLMQRSWQRPGAVTNARLAEFEACRKIDSGGEPVWVMKVFRHKTGREGPAQMSMSEKDHRLIRQYVKYARLLLDPARQVEELFVLAGPRQP